jgi:hypothetical protein
MALEQFANNPLTTVLSGGTDAPAAGTSQTWTVSDGSGFPAASSTASPATQFHVADPAIVGEIIAVTNVAGNNWTVTRGAEGTVPAAHASGFEVTTPVTAGTLGSFVQTSQMTSAIAAETSARVSAEANFIQLGGDLGGTTAAPTIGKIQGTVIAVPSGNSAQYLDATGHWSTPAGSGLTNPMTTTGDTLYGGSSGAATRLPGNTTATKKFLTETGTGSAASAPAWNTLQVSDLPTATTGAAGIVQLSGDLGGTATSPEVLKIQGTAVAAPTGSAAAYLNATGNWSTPAGGGGGGVSGWKNFISDYSADNTGAVACDTALANAIAAAVAAQPAPFGLIVPPGKYTVATNHDLPFNMIMSGAGAVGGDVTGQFIGSVFNVSSTFSGTTVASMSASYVFGFKDSSKISGDTGVNGARVSGIFIDGAAFATSAVAGFYLYGPTMCTFSDINIATMSGWAVYTDFDSAQNEQFPFGQTWDNVSANSCGVISGGGFYLNGCEDSVFLRCYSIGNNNGPGFYINGCDNTKFVGCNAEWNNTYGFYVTGDWQWFLGGCTLTGCSTDANGQYGMYIDATHTVSTTTYGTGPAIIHITGCHFRRDGQNQASGGTSAGLALGATTLPIIATGLSTIPSIGDSGGTNVQPTYGFYCSQTASTYTQPIVITSSLFWGNTHGYSNNGSTSTAPSFTAGSWASIALAHGPSQNPTYTQ